jgi:hypothetical protein
MRSGVNRADETIMRSAFNRSQNRNAYSASQQSRQAKECAMKIHSLVVVSVVATVLAMPAMAQGSMH